MSKWTKNERKAFEVGHRCGWKQALFELEFIVDGSYTKLRGASVETIIAHLKDNYAIEQP